MSKKVLTTYDVKYSITGNIVKKYLYSNPYNPVQFHNPFDNVKQKSNINDKSIELSNKNTHLVKRFGDELIPYEYMSDLECQLFGLETWSETNKKNDNIRKRSFACRRAKNKVIDLVNCNKGLRTFVTLTYASNMCDVSSAYSDFDVFRRAIKKDFPQFQYIVVVEFQSRGAVHFHMLCNINVPFVPSKGKKKTNLQKKYEVKFSKKYWKNGFVDVRPLKTKQGTDIRNVGKYIAKYMTKSDDMDKLKGLKSYSISRNLDKPIIVTCYHKEDILTDTLEKFNLDYVSQYEAKFIGEITYLEYSCDYWIYDDVVYPPLVL